MKINLKNCESKNMKNMAFNLIYNKLNKKWKKNWYHKLGDK